MGNQVGLKIKKIREEKRLSQEYLAACLDITQSNYSRLEKDDSRLTLPKIVKIAEILEVKVSTLIGENTEKVIQQNNNETANAYNTDTVNNLSNLDHVNSLKEEIAFLRKLLSDKSIDTSK